MSSTIMKWASKPLYGLPVAVIDFESTGIDAHKERAVELAVVHLDLGQSEPELVYHKRFNPEKPIPEGASKIHGIYDINVEGCDTMGDCWDEIAPFLEGRVLAAYNLPYDWTMLAREYQRASRYHPGHPPQCPYAGQFFGIDPLIMARYVDNSRRGRGFHKLEAVCGRRGIELEAHKAHSDAMATGQLIGKLLKELKLKGLRFNTFRDFWAWQRAEAMRQETALRHYFIGKGKDADNQVWTWTDM